MPITVVTNTDAVTITGPLVVQNDPAGAATTVSFDNAKITSDGSGNLNVASVAGSISGSASAIANNGTIPSSVGVQRVTAAAACTGAILAAGSRAGQQVVVINESAAANTITFAASGTSNVAGGTTVSLAGLAAHLFVWDTGTSLWYQVGPATN